MRLLTLTLRLELSLHCLSSLRRTVSGGAMKKDLVLLHVVTCICSSPVSSSWNIGCSTYDKTISVDI